MATIPDTVRVVSPRPRGLLTDLQRRRIERAAGKRDRLAVEYQRAQAAYRTEVVAALTLGASFSEVAAATGHSTKTLQTWKREAAS